MNTDEINLQLFEAFNTFKSIKDNSGSNAKSELLSKNSDNFIMKSLLFLTYNPFLVYGVKKIPDFNKSKDTSESSNNFLEFVQLLTNLKDRTITGNLALTTLSDFLSRCSKLEQEWYPRVIQKDLKVGLADKGINRVFPNLIPTYEVMLADKIPAEDLNLDTKKALSLLPDRIVTQYKIDGYRLNIFVYDTFVSVKTRNGKSVYGYTDLEKEAFSKLPKNFVYDGEIVAPELFDWIENNMRSSQSTTPDRQLFSEVMSHAFSHETNKQGIFNLFDMVPMNEWEDGKSTETLEQRTSRIKDLIAPLDLEHIRIVPTSRVYYKNNPDDLREIVDNFHTYVECGWEGIMLKNWDSVYEFKRSKNLLKMKLMQSVDLEVVDVFEGEAGTKYEGMLGGVIVDYPASDGNNYPVSVGSGWRDDERQLFWDHPELIVGKTLEVTFQSESRNQDGGYSLSFPVKKIIREDK